MRHRRIILICLAILTLVAMARSIIHIALLRRFDVLFFVVIKDVTVFLQILHKEIRNDPVACGTIMAVSFLSDWALSIV